MPTPAPSRQTDDTRCAPSVTAEAHAQRGRLLAQMGRNEEAVVSLAEACRLCPNAAMLHNDLARVLLHMRLFPQAGGMAQRALALDPGLADAHVNLAACYVSQRMFEQAHQHFNQALALHPAHPEALHAQAMAYYGSRDLPKAAEAFARLLVHRPHERHALGRLLYLRRFLGDWRDDLRLQELAEAALAGGHVPYDPLALMGITDDARAQLAAARAHTKALYASGAEGWSGPVYTHQRIRIAYLSSDFRDHAMTRLLAGVFEEHRRGPVDTLGLSLARPEDSPMGHRVRAAFGQFLDASDTSVERIAKFIRARQVDVLVDLNGFSGEVGAGVMARRPAPVQVNYLGYPGTMGAPFIDYILADAYLVPHGYRDACQEQVVYLPCFQGNDSRRHRPGPAPARDSLGLPATGFVFCTFCTPYKIAPDLFGAWMGLLAGRAGSVLWLAGCHDEAAANFRRVAAARGIDPSRLVFAPRMAYEDYLDALQRADLFLDTFPYNAGATASDVLWAGVPLVSRSGQAYASRMAGSLLTALGLQDLIATDLGGYERVALALAHDPARLAAVRARLHHARDHSPVFDSASFARNLEKGYATMVDRHRRGLPPESFSVVPA